MIRHPNHPLTRWLDPPIYVYIHTWSQDIVRNEFVWIPIYERDYHPRHSKTLSLEVCWPPKVQWFQETPTHLCSECMAYLPTSLAQQQIYRIQHSSLRKIRRELLPCRKFRPITWDFSPHGRGGSWATWVLKEGPSIRRKVGGRG